MLGHIIKGRYKLIDEIGQGTFASVYITRDLTDNHLYAVKILRHLENKAPIQRFQREAAILQQLDDPHIVRIFEYGTDNTRYYIVMGYVDGKTLREHMRPHVPLELAQALDFVQQIAEGLDTTHKKGVVHRDIKPQNILINRRGVAKIADFGLAFADTPTLSDSEGFIGTAYYVSPEQIDRAHNADIRADLYSLCIILFEMLSGEPPYSGSSLMDILTQHKTAPIPSVRQRRGDLPEGIDAFFHKGLAKSPTDRFQKPTEFLAALAQLVAPTRSAHPVPRIKVGYLVFPESGRSVLLTAGQMVVGRPARNRPLPDISLEDDKVGRQQATIGNQEGRYTIKDLKSTNPTRLNGMHLTPHEEQILKEGDIIHFGPVEARFELRE